VTYTVDGLNRRVGKQVEGRFSRAWLYQDPLRPAAEVTDKGVFSQFIYASGSTPDFMLRGGVAFRFVKDHLGSVHLVVNATTGAVVQALDYDEFGNVTRDTAPGLQPFGFAGGLYDADTGLVRFGARDYDLAKDAMQDILLPGIHLIFAIILSCAFISIYSFDRLVVHQRVRFAEMWKRSREPRPNYLTSGLVWSRSFRSVLASHKCWLVWSWSTPSWVRQDQIAADHHRRLRISTLVSTAALVAAACVAAFLR
jgi:hypothetical protein